MTVKKTDGGKGTGPSPSSRRKRAAGATKKSEPVSSAKPSKPTSRVGKKSSTAKQTVQPAEELYANIAKRAYELYESRGGHHGEDFHDWLEAEQQILKEKESRKP